MCWVLGWGLCACCRLMLCSSMCGQGSAPWLHCVLGVEDMMAAAGRSEPAGSSMCNRFADGQRCNAQCVVQYGGSSRNSASGGCADGCQGSCCALLLQYTQSSSMGTGLSSTCACSQQGQATCSGSGMLTSVVDWHGRSAAAPAPGVQSSSSSRLAVWASSHTPRSTWFAPVQDAAPVGGLIMPWWLSQSSRHR